MKLQVTRKKFVENGAIIYTSEFMANNVSVSFAYTITWASKTGERKGRIKGEGVIKTRLLY